jgi:uncharacterized protein (TIGR00299 family) protein
VHIHLDPVGGIAGDMFVAALLDAWPELAHELPAQLTLAGLPNTIKASSLLYHFHGLQGTRFRVTDGSAIHGHPRIRFQDIRERLANSALAAEVKHHALDIFALLAQAEGRVHGIQADEVTFHEVGAWDSMADIVAAAFLIATLPIKSWSISALPLGSGQVPTAHGLLPVPAPATTLLLEGFVVHDDGLEGERVTPTGAAILKHLAPTYRCAAQPMVMGRTGIGFGTRRFENIPNILRLYVLEPVEAQPTDKVAVIHFEIDDQPAEDLAVGLDRLRRLSGVIDIVQIPVFGKQGRLVTQIQILAHPEALKTVVACCFTETTTLGLRWQIVNRSVLSRCQREYRGDHRQRIGVKMVQRPNGFITAKAEIRDVAEAEGGFAERQRLRQQAERTLLERGEEENDD